MSTLLEALKKSERARRLVRAPAYREVGVPTTSLVLRSVSLVAVITLVVVLAWSAWLVTRSPAPIAMSTEENTAVANSVSIPKLPVPSPVTAAPEVPRPDAPAAHAAPAPQAAITPPHAASSRIASRPARTVPAPRAAPWLSELPASFRERLPALVVNIHVYSPNASQRILYINNRPCQPGQEIGGGVVVEDILPDGVLLSFDHQRFRLPRPT